MRWTLTVVALLVGLLVVLGGCDSRPKVATVGGKTTVSSGRIRERGPRLELARPPSDHLVVLAAGDVGLGRGVGTRILGSAAYDPFEYVRSFFATADLVLANLESQLSDQGGQTVHPRNYLVFTGPPTGAALLAQAGFSYVSVANNHAWDYGQQAFFETLDHLDAAQVAYSGGSRVPAERFAPAVLRRGNWSVAVFAATHIWNQPPYREHPGRNYVAWAHHGAFAGPLAQARRDHDVVLMSYHGGGEYIDHPLPRMRRFYDQVLDSGVDAVLGHHPHVPQGVRFTNGRPGFYSLGNLVFEPFYSEWTETGLVVRLTFERDVPGMPAVVELCPVAIGDDDRPRLLDALPRAERDHRLTAVRERLRETSHGPLTIGDPGEHGCMSVASAPAG